MQETEDELEEPAEEMMSSSIFISDSDITAQSGRERVVVPGAPAGAYSTPAHLKLLLPPKVGVHVQRRVPDGVVQIWYPSRPSKTFRFAQKNQYTNETIPQEVSAQAVRDATEWAWNEYAKEQGEQAARAVLAQQMEAANEAGLPPL